jgi:response regulator RpfG family c-di-GMP phosphodiesterase
MPEERRHTILLVDDEDNVRAALRRTLRSEGYEILEAVSGEEGLEVLRARPVDVVITDHAMPKMTGLEFLRAARLHRPDSLRIILTGRADLEMAIRAINEGAIYRFLLKPWDQLDLRVTLSVAIRHLEAERRNAHLLDLVRRQAHLLDRLLREHPEVLAAEAAPGAEASSIVSADELALLGGAPSAGAATWRSES